MGKTGKTMTDLHRLMKTKDFKNVEEAKKFLEEFIENQEESEMDWERLTNEEKAVELVDMAVEEEDVYDSERLLHEAFTLDPDCADVYECLGANAEGPFASLLFYKMGMEAGKRKLGEQAFAEAKGHFWMIPETRPFMRCMKGYAECLFMLGKEKESLDVFFEMLELNPNDNQGVRDLAGLFSLAAEEFSRYEKLYQLYKSDATAFHAFNFALYNFLLFGDAPQSREALAQARAVNNHVLGLMLSKKPLPETPEDFITLGGKSEAINYCSFAKIIWMEKPGAIEWLEKVYLKK
jgi:tetratricopeptide (TPR) repeat protein